MRSASSPEQQVIDAAVLRARALADADEGVLRELMHPDLQWTTYRGDVLSYGQYIEACEFVFLTAPGVRPFASEIVFCRFNPHLERSATIGRMRRPR